MEETISPHYDLSTVFEYDVLPHISYYHHVVDRYKRIHDTGSLISCRLNKISDAD
jgi:hypothetical protein